MRRVFTLENPLDVWMFAEHKGTQGRAAPVGAHHENWRNVVTNRGIDNARAKQAARSEPGSFTQISQSDFLLRA